MMLIFLSTVKQVFNNTKTCPLPTSNIVEKYFDSEGDKLLIGKRSVTITVPKGAVTNGDEVQIQAAASLIGPYIIPEGYHPVSAFVWIGVSYTFEKHVLVQIEHHAALSQQEVVLQMNMLTPCHKEKVTNNDGRNMYTMHEPTCLPQCIIKELVFIYSTDNSCSNCLAKRNEKIPDKIVVYHMLYESADLFASEVCFCYNLELCKKVITMNHKFCICYPCVMFILRQLKSSLLSEK